MDQTPPLALHRPAAHTWLVLEGWHAAVAGRLALVLPVCMAAGILVYFSLRHEPAFLPAAAAAALLLGAAVRAGGALPQVALLMAACGALGFAAAGVQTWRAPPWIDLPRHAVIISGRVTSVERLPEGRRVTIAAAALDGGATQPRSVRVRLRTGDPALLSAGDRIQVRALLRPPAAPAYPGGWDMQRDAWFAGLGGYGFAIGPAARLDGAPETAWQAVRERIAARIAGALPDATGAVAATLLTGLGTAIPAADRAAFQVSGLAHLLAVAGLHIGIVMGFVFGTFRFALAGWEHAALHWPVRQIAAVAALLAGLFYLELTGAHVPILRSFAMACLVTLALLTGRRAISLRTLALAAVPLMLLAPARVMGVSFQMSFAAVLALTAGWQALWPRLARAGAGRWWRAPASYAGGLAVTSALAGTASLPFAAYHFGTACLFYVPANMLAVPLTAFWVLPWGVVALALMPLGLERLALAPMGLGIQGLVAIAHTVAAWPGAVWQMPQMPPWGLLLVAGGLVWLCILRTWRRLLGCAPMLAGVLSPWIATAPDAIVSADARLIAVRANGTVRISLARGADRFASEVPGRLWGDLPRVPFGDGAVQQFSLGGTAIAVIAGAADGCGTAAVVLSHAPLRGRCGSAMVVDRFSVLNDGATELFITRTGPRLRTDRQRRGDRPWVVAAARQTTPSLLPPAATE